MADVVDKETRSRMMSGIRAKNTKPEMVVRRGIFRRGFRYRIHVRSLPGRPDLVLPRYGAVVFVHGCFWHRHDCELFRWPQSKKVFWRKKLDRNAKLDRLAIQSLREAGWRVLVVWECAIKGHNRGNIPRMLTAMERWLKSRSPFRELSGRYGRKHTA